MRASYRRMSLRSHLHVGISSFVEIRFRIVCILVPLRQQKVALTWSKFDTPLAFNTSVRIVNKQTKASRFRHSVQQRSA